MFIFIGTIIFIIMNYVYMIRLIKPKANPPQKKKTKKKKRIPRAALSASAASLSSMAGKVTWARGSLPIGP